jgi:hypothetical protein
LSRRWNLNAACRLDKIGADLVGEFDLRIVLWRIPDYSPGVDEAPERSGIV